MKKSVLLSLLLIWSLALVACDVKSEWDSENVLPTEPINMECIKAVEDYLNSADKVGHWEEVKVWDNIVVDYIWRLEDGTVFDTSVKSVAEACGKYNEARDYTEWLSFEVWAWQMIKWFDNWVVWMKLWQTKTVEFGPDEWYWQRNEQYVMTYTAEEVGDLSQFQEWQTVYLWMWAAARIIKVTDKEITLDLNHELAWKNLIFDITVKSIN